MKVKLRADSPDFFRSEHEEFDSNNEYIVLGIYYYKYDDKREVMYIIKGIKYWQLCKIEYFNISENSIPNGWTIKEGVHDDEVFITYGEFSAEVYEDFFSIGGYNYIDYAYPLEVKRYYFLEVEEFFSRTNLDESQKQSMIEYYKSQPNREQWDSDVEFLSEYVVNE